jgi:hypothetical protein
MPPLDPVPRWPIAVSLRALGLPELQELLRRRDIVQRRRALRRGVARLFRHAGRRHFSKGSGFWLAPHLWYVPGMSRDTDEGATDAEGAVVVEIVGPMYARVFPHPARQHLHQVLGRLEVDLIYVEDGVGMRGVRRVLEGIFRHFDEDDGRLEDRHLRAIRGVRCIVHDFDFDRPLRRKAYPEPDYEELGRARILHVFRDRGDHEELPEIPISLDRLLLTV